VPPVEKLVIDLAGVISVGQCQCQRAVPLDLNDCYCAVRQNSAGARTRGEVFETGRRLRGRLRSTGFGHEALNLTDGPAIGRPRAHTANPVA